MVSRIALLSLLAASTCAHGDGGSKGSRQPLSEAAMERHFEEAEEIRTAALRGEVDTVREVSVAFAARVAESTYPEPWAPSVTRLEHVLQAAAEVDDMRKGAALVGEVGASCGGCHRDHEVPVERRWPLEPDPEHRMDSFAYATELLWLGLVVPSDEAWARGADAYHAALSCEDFESVPVGSYHVSQCSSVRATGASVLGARDDAARARAFADVVLHCASCHGKPG